MRTSPKALAVTAFFAATTAAFAQAPVPPKAGDPPNEAPADGVTPDAAPPTQNVLYFEELLLGLNVALPGASVVFEGNDTKSEFKANVTGSTGLMISYLGWGASLSFRNEQPDQDPGEFGQTDFRDLQLHHHNQKFGVDLHFQRYKGFYRESLSEGCERGQSCSLRPKLGLFNVGAAAYYQLDPDYSHQAAFTHDARQIESAGSWLLMATAGRVLLTGEGPLIPTSDREAFDEIGTLSRGLFDTATVSGGYGQNWIWRRFFLGAAALFGPGVQRREYYLLGPQETVEEFALAAHFSFRAALGYAGDNNHLGIRALTYGPISYIDDLEIRVLTNLVEIYWGYRFKD